MRTEWTPEQVFTERAAREALQAMRAADTSMRARQLDEWADEARRRVDEAFDHALGQGRR